MKWVLRPPWAAPRRNGDIEMRNELLASIVATSNDAILSYSLDRNITSWNPAAKRIFGYSADEMIGQPFSVLIPSEKAGEAVDFQERLERGEMISNYETVRLRKDGSTVPISLNLSLIYDLSGAVIGGSSIYRDLTELKKSGAHKEMLALIVESSNEAIWSWTLDGIVTVWNPAAERVFGYSADELIGQVALDLYPPDKLDETVELIDKTRKGQPITNFETVRLRKDGRAVPVVLTISPICDPTGAVIGGASIYRDLTEIKMSEMRNALLAAIVTSSNDAISSFTRDGIISSWNPGAERIFGYSTDEMIDQPFSVLVPSERIVEVADILGKIKKGQPIVNFETVRLRKNGSTVPVLQTISPIFDLTGAVIGGSAISLDMTELKRAEHKFHTIVESAPDAIVIADITGSIIIVNSQTEEMFGYRRDEMLGQPVEMLVPSRFQVNDPALRESYVAHYLEQRSGFLGGSNFYGRRKDGREFPIEVNLSPLDFTEGTVYAGTIRDVTDHKSMIRRLEEMNELRNEFVAVVAHDLRAPLISISGFAQVLIEQWNLLDNDERNQYLRVIARNAENLGEFVEDVLQVARIESGEYTYNIHQFDIRSLVQRVLDDTAGVSNDRQIEFTVSGDIPPVLGDEDRQRQVLTNLLSNAVRFSPAEEPIVVGLSCIDGSVQVAISDRGIGIAKDDLAKLFQKSVRGSNPAVRKIPGNGLGLYICKTLVEAQGGRIWCESSPGRGSTFIFTVPVAR